jgi:hypothetical protein
MNGPLNENYEHNPIVCWSRASSTLTSLEENFRQGHPTKIHTFQTTTSGLNSEIRDIKYVDVPMKES